jgi:hypothetical protein
MEQVWFCRQSFSGDWRSVKVGPKNKLRALLAVSNPSDLDAYGLAPLNTQAELERVRNALRIRHKILPDEDCVLSLENLLKEIRDGADVVYLACHGRLSNTGIPHLFLQKEDGTVDLVDGGVFVDRLKTLEKLPRLLVLVSCQSAGSGGRGALASLASLLSGVGVPAIMAMQGNVSFDMVNDFIPAFFSELDRDGQIDRAMAFARNTVQAQSDFWIPTLFLRSLSGKLWTSAGVAQEREDEPGRILPYLANRTDQEDLIEKTVKTRLDINKPSPMVFLVLGSERQCQDMYVERLKEETIPFVTETKSRFATESYVVSWPEGSKPLIDFDRQLEKSIKAVATQKELDNLRCPIIFSTQISIDAVSHRGLEAIKAYLNFWQNWPSLAPGRYLFVFLFLKYPLSSGGFSGMLAERRLGSLRRMLGELPLDRYDRILASLMPELGNISQQDAENWARKKIVQDGCAIHQQEMVNMIRDFFIRHGKPMCMEDLAICLKTFLKSSYREEAYP